MTSSGKLVLGAAARSDLVAHATEGAGESPPAEVCGVLAGTRGGDGADRVTETRRVRNVAGSPRFAYELDPVAAMETIDDLEAAGRDVVGFYHSHPEGRARLSATDRDQATWRGYVYLIVGLGGDDPELGAWRFTGTGFEGLDVAVE